MLIYDHHYELALWAGLQLGYGGPIRSTEPKAIGVARGGKIVAAAIFYDYRLTTIEVTFVTTEKRWASRQAIKAILHYPFVQLGCRRLNAITEQSNLEARDFLERLGFMQEGVHPDAFQSGTGLSYGLLRDAAERWLK